MTKPITETLRLLQGGTFNDDAGRKLSDLVKGVDETGKAGRLTITIDIKKSGGAVAVRAKATGLIRRHGFWRHLVQFKEPCA